MPRFRLHFKHIAKQLSFIAIFVVPIIQLVTVTVHIHWLLRVLADVCVEVKS